MFCRSCRTLHKSPWTLLDFFSARRPRGFFCHFPGVRISMSEEKEPGGAPKNHPPKNNPPKNQKRYHRPARQEKLPGSTAASGTEAAALSENGKQSADGRPAASGKNGHRNERTRGARRAKTSGAGSKMPESTSNRAETKGSGSAAPGAPPRDGRNRRNNSGSGSKKSAKNGAVIRPRRQIIKKSITF